MIKKYRIVIVGITSFLIVQILVLHYICPKLDVPFNTIVALLPSIVLGIIFVLFFDKILVQQIEQINNLIHQKQKNIDYSTQIEAEIWKETHQNIKNILEINQKATHFAKKIGEGDFKAEYKTSDKNDTLGQVLVEMRDKLISIAHAEEKRNWSNLGISKFDQLIRENLNVKIEDLTYLLISNLCKYIGLNQGGIYLLNDTNPEDKYLELVSFYAFEKRKYQKRRIDFGEGVLGQCFLEKEHILITEVPIDYIQITSGLGYANPRCILLVPIQTDEFTLGVMELASFQILETYQIDLVKLVCDSFASTYSTIKSNSNVSKLLDETKVIMEELQEKEQKLLNSEIDLKNAQQTLQHKLIELMAETNLNKSILAAINKSYACIQFDMSGNILDANEMFLSVMGYDLNEIMGKNESMFVLAHEIGTERYEMLWNSLKEGNFNAGEFRRKAKNGKEIWMDVTYNPILDLEGKAFKILMFAKFTTDEKERENGFRNKLNAFNESVPSAELSMEGSFKSANASFMKLTGIKRKEFKTVKFWDLTANETENSTLKNAILSLNNADNFQNITEKIYLKNSETQSTILTLLKIFPNKNIDGVPNGLIIICLTEDVLNQSI